MVYYTKPYVLVNPFFEFLFFLTIIENMPYRTQISPQNSRKERISRSFLKPLRGYDGFNSLLYHLGNLCCLHSLVFLVWDRVEKMDFYRYGTDGIGVKRNKTVFNATGTIGHFAFTAILKLPLLNSSSWFPFLLLVPSGNRMTFCLLLRHRPPH